MVILSLLLSDRRVHPSGRALCLLVRSKHDHAGRAVALALSGLVVLGALVVLSPWAFWAVAIASAVLLGPQLLLSLRAHSARGQLARTDLKGPCVGVHTVSSVLPGAGLQLMQSLNEEADRKGWALVLDAANEPLAAYYAGLGFVAVSEPMAMPWGESTVRMKRSPTHGGSPR